MSFAPPPARGAKNSPSDCFYRTSFGRTLRITPLLLYKSKPGHPLGHPGLLTCRSGGIRPAPQSRRRQPGVLKTVHRTVFAALRSAAPFESRHFSHTKANRDTPLGHPGLHTCRSGGIRPAPQSRRRQPGVLKTVHRTVFAALRSTAPFESRRFCYTKANRDTPLGIPVCIRVEVAGFEPAAFWSRTPVVSFIFINCCPVFLKLFAGV